MTPTLPKWKPRMVTRLVPWVVTAVAVVSGKMGTPLTLSRMVDLAMRRAISCVFIRHARVTCPITISPMAGEGTLVLAATLIVVLEGRVPLREAVSGIPIPICLFLDPRQRFTDPARTAGRTGAQVCWKGSAR